MVVLSMHSSLVRWRLAHRLPARRPRVDALLVCTMLVCAMLVPAHVRAQAAGQESAPAATPAVSRAEALLFETDHLARVKAPAMLVYRFRKESNVEPGFSDKVQLDLASNIGKTDATLHFLSGDRRQDIPALENAHGNPVLLGFLERDIAEMKRLTGGSTVYFRKRIRMALALDAQVSTTSITYNGKTLAAQSIRIQPYLHDPMHARFEPYIHKTYTFVVADQVPGGVYQLRSSLANGGENRVAGTVPASTAAAPAGAARTALGGAATAGQAAAMAGTAASGPPVTALPAIDETLTLVSVTHPKR